MTRFRSLFSFSNVIAVLALFFALGGTVYAASKISGSQIKPKSIPANRIKPRSLTGSQIKPGSLTGSQIAESSLKGVSAGSLATVQYVSTPVSIVAEATAGTTGVASCPSGQKIIGGGATVSNETFAYVNDSGPTVDRSGWIATAYSGVTGATMVVTAICTPVTSPIG